MKWYYNSKFKVHYQGACSEYIQIIKFAQEIEKSLIEESSLNNFIADLRSLSEVLAESLSINSFKCDIEVEFYYNNDSLYYDVFAIGTDFRTNILTIEFVQPRNIIRYEEKLNFTEE